MASWIAKSWRELTSEREFFAITLQACDAGMLSGHPLVRLPSRIRVRQVYGRLWRGYQLKIASNAPLIPFHKGPEEIICMRER